MREEEGGSGDRRTSEKESLILMWLVSAKQRNPKTREKQARAGREACALEKVQTVGKAEKFFESQADIKRKRHSARRRNIEQPGIFPPERP